MRKFALYLLLGRYAQPTDFKKLKVENWKLKVISPCGQKIKTCHSADTAGGKESRASLLSDIHDLVSSLRSEWHEKTSWGGTPNLPCCWASMPNLQTFSPAERIEIHHEEWVIEFLREGLIKNKLYSPRRGDVCDSRQTLAEPTRHESCETACRMAEGLTC